MKNKIIWLSGSRGFVGNYLKDYLLHTNNKLFCITNSKISFDKNVFPIDFSCKKNIRNFVKKNGAPDIFYHLGWGDVYKPHEISQYNNYVNSVNLIDVLFEEGTKKIIHTGSSSEYGKREGILSEEMPITHYENNYIKEKVRLCDYGMERSKKLGKVFINVRLFYAYGQGQRTNSLINLLYKAYSEKEIIKLSSGEHFRDYIYISDVVEGLFNISKINSSEIINLGTGKVIKIKDFILNFWDSLKGDRNLLHFGGIKNISDQPKQPWAFADMSKLEKLTNWKPKVDIQLGIKKTTDRLKLTVVSDN